jgi:hypothetical protein
MGYFARVPIELVTVHEQTNIKHDYADEGLLAMQYALLMMHCFSLPVMRVLLGI